MIEVFDYRFINVIHVVSCLPAYEQHASGPVASFASCKKLRPAFQHHPSHPLPSRRSFNFKTTHPDGSKDSKSLLGMPKESKWVLYGNDEADLTRGMRDFVTYNLARASGEYATR